MTLTAVVAIMTMVPPGLASEDTALPPEIHAQIAEPLHSAPVMLTESTGQFAEGVRFQVRRGSNTLPTAPTGQTVTPADAQNVELVGHIGGTTYAVQSHFAYVAGGKRG